MKQKMYVVSTYVTGSKRGYINAKYRGVESDFFQIPEKLTGLRGNMRWALRQFKNHGATHYTLTNYQGVPYKGYSNQYCYTEYIGYIIDNKK